MDPCTEWWEMFWTGVGAIGSIAVAILAISGDELKARFLPARGSIETHDPGGDIVTVNLRGSNAQPINVRAIYFHLEVVNLWRTRPLKDAEVKLIALSRAHQGSFVRNELSVPRSFKWSPSMDSKQFQTIVADRVFDFGRICVSEQRAFNPFVNDAYYDEFLLALPRHPVIYHLQIVASNYASDEESFKVTWDGEFEENPELMRGHITIERVSSDHSRIS